MRQALAVLLVAVGAMLVPADSMAARVAHPIPLDADVHPGRGIGDHDVASRQARATDGIAAVVSGEVISIGEVHRALELLRQPRLAPLAGGCGALPADISAEPSPAPVSAVEPGEPADGTGESPDEDPGDDPLPAAPLDGKDGTPPEEIDVGRALECLIDGVLVFREVRRFPSLAVTEATLQEAFEELVASFPSREAFDAALEDNHLTPRQVRRDLEQRLLVAAYIDSRFRATVQFSREEVARFWEEELAPEMREQGIDVPELDAVAEEYVRPILREREVNRRIQSWIRDLRRRAEIRRLYPSDGDS